VNRYLAAHAFASWMAYQGRGLRGWVRSVAAAHETLTTETARHSAQAGRPLDRELHQVFDVYSIIMMSKRFIQYFNGCLRRHFSRFRASHAIRNSEDSPLTVSQVGILVERPSFVEAAVGKR
jgi:hypothetical protein